MSSSGKRKDDDVRASDDETETDAPAKKVAKLADSSNKSESVVICNIGKHRRLSVTHCKGRISISIRDFYVKDGKTVTCNRGVSLTLDQWNALRSHTEDIDKALSDLS